MIKKAKVTCAADFDSELSLLKLADTIPYLDLLDYWEDHEAEIRNYFPVGRDDVATYLNVLIRTMIYLSEKWYANREELMQSYADNIWECLSDKERNRHDGKPPCHDIIDIYAEKYYE